MLEELCDIKEKKKERLDLWEVIDLVVLDRGEEQLGNLSEYGMEFALEKYGEGNFNSDAHIFYGRNFEYFSNYKNQKSLFETRQKFNKLIECGKIRL